MIVRLQQVDMRMAPFLKGWQEARPEYMTLMPVDETGVTGQPERGVYFCREGNQMVLKDSFAMPRTLMERQTAFKVRHKEAQP
jgi:hypothetical protein